MVRSLCRLVPFVVLAAAALYLPALASADATKPYIVVFAKSSAAGARAATEDLSDDEHFKPSQVYDDALHGFAAKLDAHDLDAVRDDPRVAKVVSDKPVEVASLVPLAAGDNIPQGVRRVGAAVGNTVHEAATAPVAVIDTGIDLSHPDLNAVAGRNCQGSGAPNDDNGHGTHVAGTIGAKNNGTGAIGVAPGTKLYAVKVLSASGSGYQSQIICGIDWVTSTRTDADPANDIAVANMSLGGGMTPNDSCGRGSVYDPEHIAICNSIAAGVTYVVAAGNSSTDEQTFAPANYPEVLTVTAVSDSDGVGGAAGGALSCIANADDTAASYSNYATRAVDQAHTIAAPGSCIRSTYPQNRYATMSGTSMASPHMAGVVALCIGEGGAHGPCWGQTPANVKAIVMAAAATRGALDPGKSFGGSPVKPTAGRFYGNMASLDFPSAAGVVPVVSAAPAISGAAVTGQTLTAGHGTFTNSPTSYSYEWRRCTSASDWMTCTATVVPTGTTITYAPVSADVGRYLRVRVVATNAEGSAIAVSPATAVVTTPPVIAPVNTAAPVLSGVATVSGTLSATTGTWTGTSPSFRYQWVRCATATATTCATLTGATASSYHPVAGDVGSFMRVIVSAVNSKATVAARSAATAQVTDAQGIAAIAPVGTTGPQYTGTPRVGSTLTGSPGAWTGTAPTFAYQWMSCTTTNVSTCANISGATRAAFLLTTGDRGKYLRVAVTATNAKASVYSRSGPIGPIA